MGLMGSKKAQWVAGLIPMKLLKLENDFKCAFELFDEWCTFFVYRSKNSWTGEC